MVIWLISTVSMAAGPSRPDLRCSLAGTWYPADPNALKAQLRRCLEGASVQARQDVIGLILPHAGYAYSGPSAGKGLSLAGRSYKRIIVIGPSHRFPADEVLMVPRAGSFHTPLGPIPLDGQVVDRLLKETLFKDVPDAFNGENSVEIQLPLLQGHQAAGGFKLVPILAGRCSLGTIQRAAAVLRTCVDPNTLVVASSDFTHYGPSYGYVPFTDNVPQRLRDLDMGAFRCIEAMDAKGFVDYQRETGATICGYVPVAILLSMVDRSAKARLVDYTTSGQVTSDYTNSVSYLSVAFTGTWSARPGVPEVAAQATLSAADRKQLLALARKTIVYFLQHDKVPLPSDLGIQVRDAAKVRRAAFVTLKKRGELRGCIGDVLPRQALFQSVIENAVNAAVRDPRFPPVVPSECNELTIEISALTVPRPVASPDEIRLGTDGIILTKGPRSALFLPQVAPEQGWNLQQTLEHLCLKAGMPRNAWREGASLQVFQAEVFGEP